MDFYFYKDCELYTSTLQPVVVGNDVLIPAVNIDTRKATALYSFTVIDRDDVKIYLTESDARSERPYPSTADA